MSYDRVLPKPPALHYDSQVTLSRPTSNLLEHKIMNDDLTKMSVLDHHRRDAPSVGASCRYVADALPQVHLSSLNRAKIALNKIASTAPIDPPRSTEPGLTPQLPLRERSSVSERSSSASPTKRESETKFCLCQPDPKIPRPRNAFILYRQHYQAAVVASNPGLANPEVSKIIGIQWRSLPQDTKDEWKKLAEAEKARHQQQYPEYRYQPRRYGRDGSSRGTSSGISHNPNGSSVCSRCGGRVMNPPVSPDAIFTPNGSTSSSASSATPEAATVRNYHCRATDADRGPHPVKVETTKVEVNGLHASRQRQWEESGVRSPDSKRRRFNPQPTFKSNSHRERSPETPYPISPYTPRADVPSNYRGPHHTFQMWQPPRPLRSAHPGPPHDPSLTLPPLQTTATTPVAMTPVTPFPKEGSSVEATVMTIPFLNKLKVISKIAPPLTPPFREGAAQRRGAVIAVEGQDSKLVNAMVDHLNHVLQKEGKYQPRVFPGPKVPTGEKYSEPSQTGHGTVDYIHTISGWNTVSKDIVRFVAPELSETKSVDEESATPGMSPKTIIPKTAEMHISSPSQSSDNGSVSAGSSSGASTCFVPVALVPQYQLTTADFFACSVPLNDSYAVLDHWQWMASLWRGCVGADITVYIRDCEKEELDRYGGNPVEVRLQDARTVVLRRAAGSTRDLDEKALKRVGFEIEFFLSQ